MYKELKSDILGKDYELSVALVEEKKSRQLNKKYRRKDKPTNVLSFSLAENSGELVLCPALIRREAEESGRTYRDWLRFLVIHGMLHLKGMEHGSIMEKAERFFFKKHDQKHFNRHRHGLLDHPGGGGRVHKRRKKS